MKQIKSKADYLIEIAYEAVNPLGGVYTVLATKAKEINDYYKGKYFIVGPYFKKYASVEFEEQIPTPEIVNIFNELKKEGIICHYGYWLIEGKPKTFLIDFSQRLKKLKEIKRSISESYGIDFKLYKFSSKPKKSDYYTKSSANLSLSLVWADSTIRLIKRLLKINRFKNKSGVLQFHSDSGRTIYPLIKDLKDKNSKLGIVITFHSTRLGRAIAFNKEDLNKEIKVGLKKGRKIKNRREYSYGGFDVVSHQFEKLGVKYADVLTSVSEITGKEMKYILGRKPDVITPNGLDMSRFPSLEERAILHHNSKEKLYRFLNAYFLPYYPVDVPNSLLFFTSGRYELITKGYDILFEALCKLNEILKKENYQNNIFVFLFIMTTAKEVNKDVLQNMSIYKKIEQSVKQEQSRIKGSDIPNLIYGNKQIKKFNRFEHLRLRTKKLMFKFRRKKNENPSISTFKWIRKDFPIKKLLLKYGLNNKKGNAIKIIFYPTRISTNDDLLSMRYREVISGMHLGIFPSLYEPWGYTPLETAANGVMSITTDVAGFGKFILKNSDQRKKPGILVLKVKYKEKYEIVNNLVNILRWFIKIPEKKRIEKKIEAKNLSTLADWKEFAKYYIKAHNLAIDRYKARRKK